MWHREHDPIHEDGEQVGASDPLSGACLVSVISDIGLVCWSFLVGGSDGLSVRGRCRGGDCRLNWPDMGAVVAPAAWGGFVTVSGGQFPERGHGDVALAFEFFHFF